MVSSGPALESKFLLGFKSRSRIIRAPTSARSLSPSGLKTYVKDRANELHGSGHKVEDSAHQVKDYGSFGGGVFSVVTGGSV